jgi:NADH-quinone oxidoreductase subunit L
MAPFDQLAGAVTEQGQTIGGRDGVEGSATARHPAFASCGKGRKQASDGGAWTAAMFHLFTHAFFKACLFLGAGSLSHACHHSFNMVDDMGGLRKIMPRTFATYLVGTLALAGIFPLSGFWSKDEILTGTGSFPGSDGANGSYHVMMVMLLIAAFCTAAYMTRTIWYAFFGEFRGHGHPHESGPRITVPLIILATLGAVVKLAAVRPNLSAAAFTAARSPPVTMTEPAGKSMPSAVNFASAIFIGMFFVA